MAAAESRSLRRSVPGRLLSVPLPSFVVALFALYAHLHGHAQALPSTSCLAPRFLIYELGVYPLWLSLVAVVCLAFDTERRDASVGLADAIDSRPLSNFALRAGRLIGIVATAWIPLAVGFAVIQVLGALPASSDRLNFEAVEPVSLATFLLLDALPVLVLWCSVVLLLASWFRNRLVVCLVSLVVLALATSVVSNSPVYLLQALSPVSVRGFASDLVPRTVDAWVVWQRVSIIAFAGGLLCLASMFGRRMDVVRPVRSWVAFAVFAGGGATGVGAVASGGLADVEQRRSWLAAHEQSFRRRNDGFHLESVVGQVSIDPGVSLTFDIEIVLSAAEADLSTLVFSLNPGMRVTKLQIPGMARYWHEQGLLTVEVDPLPHASRVTLDVAATGVPDPRFAYLDAAVHPQRVRNRNWLWQLGEDASIFESTYVALMPDTHWLPMPGANVEDNTRSDRFELSLLVEVPDGWIVAGAGPPRLVDGSASQYTFNPKIPVGEVGLLASRFDRRSLQIGSKQVELLADRRHLRNLASLYHDRLPAALRAYFEDAADAGLAYPYEALTVVEAPAHLRSYGSGWLLDSALVLPGVLIIKETTATARFERQLAMFTRWSNSEDAKSRVLNRFLRGDDHGVDLEMGFASNLAGQLGHRTMFEGSAEGMPELSNTSQARRSLDLLIRHLVYRAIVTRWDVGSIPQVFSAHTFNRDAGLAALLMAPAAMVFKPDLPRFAHTSSVVDRPDVWEVLERSLPMDQLASRHPQAAYASALAALVTADAIFDSLGRQSTARLLADLHDRSRATSINATDFMAAADKLEDSLGSLAMLWLNGGPLPAFRASKAEITQLSDASDGKPRYQTLLHVRNDATRTPGLVTIATRRDLWGDNWGPFRVEPLESVQIGMITPQPPWQLWLHSYLSLNRAPVRLVQPEPRQGGGQPFAGVRSSDWLPREEAGIIVDDLDAVLSPVGASLPRLGHSAARHPVYHDRGIPQYQGYAGTHPAEWHREVVPWAWGRYRKTLVRARTSPAADAPSVSFVATLPAQGRWRLDYHLPGRPESSAPMVRPMRAHVDLLGTHELRIVSEAGVLASSFDGAAATPGWNKIGDFNLGAGRVAVLVGRRGSGELIVADAIRWSPSETGGA